MERLIIPAGEGRAFHLSEGQGLRIITPKGKKPFVGKYKKSKAKVWEQEMMVLFQVVTLARKLMLL